MTDLGHALVSKRCQAVIEISCDPWIMSSKAGELTHLLLSATYMSMNYVNIGSDNGLAPVRRQAIIWTNAGLLSIEPLRTISNQNTKFFINENASENIACEMAAILSRGRGVNAPL